MLGSNGVGNCCRKKREYGWEGGKEAQSAGAWDEPPAAVVAPTGLDPPPSGMHACSESPLSLGLGSGQLRVGRAEGLGLLWPGVWGGDDGGSGGVKSLDIQLSSNSSWETRLGR